MMTSGRGVRMGRIRGLRGMGKDFFGSKRCRVVLKANLIGQVCSRIMGIAKANSRRGSRRGRGMICKGGFRETVEVFSSMFIPVVPILMTANLFVKLEKLLARRTMLTMFNLATSDVPRGLLAFARMLASATFTFLPTLIY